MPLCACGELALESLETRCAKCHAAYQRRWRSIRTSRLIQKARREGADAMKILIIEVMEGKLGTLEINGRAAAAIVREIRLD